ncbi:hypothetical protein R4227_12415 [Gordonia amicalis]|uniref:hypothetical protein n=1 Tax=Gordonia amicalis TaxID=89053 RepID=UPI002953D7CD|nr:hypothetical protein [Gordonia amicalis]MDV7100916.1 hypothetical protein [Gordonia amicalis]
MSKKKSWKELSPTAKAAIVTVAAVDAGTRVWALRDLAGRQADEINGPKRAWVIGLSLGSTAGIAPAIYLLWGRKHRK